MLDARGEKRVRLSRRTDAAVRLRRYQTVGQAQIRLAQLVVQAYRVCAEARLAGCEELRAGRVGRERAVQIVRNAAHHPLRMARGDGQGTADLAELRGSPRQLERARYLAAACGRFEQALVGSAPLQVV